MWNQLELSAADLLLRDILLERNLVPAQKLQELLSKHQTQRQNSLSELSGQLIQVQAHKLQLRDLLQDKLLSEHVFGSPTSYPLTQWGRDLILIEPHQGRQAKILRLPSDCSPGLVSSEEFNWLCWQGVDQALELGLSETLITPEMGARPELCDLYLDPQGRLLVVAHRLRGSVSLISLLTRRLLFETQIRQPGSQLAINVAIDPGGKRVYLSDNLSPKLYILDVDSRRVMPLQTGLGVLSSLVLGPESQFLYLCTREPELELKCFDLETFSVFQELDIKGQSYCKAGRMPYDPLVMSADGEFAILMGYLDEPVPFTPVINVIRTSKIRTVRRYTIKEDVEPWLLATQYLSPLAQNREFELAQSLLEQGLLEAELLEGLQQEVQQALGSVQSFDPHLSEQQAVSLLERPAPPLVLSAEADEVIIELLVRAFYQEQLTNLRVHPGDLRNLRSAAIEIRQELEHKYAVEAEITGLLGQFTLQTLITREALLSLLEQQQYLKEAIFKPEDLCPMCQASLSADRACRKCGFQLSQQEDQAKRALVSAEVSTAGLAGQFLVALPERGKVVLLNFWQHILWELNTSLLKEPIHALFMNNQHILVTDRALGKIMEFTPSGNLVWQSAQTFERPVMASWYQVEGEERFIVLDQGARQLVVFNRHQQLRWSYAGSGLLGPSDVQRTHQASWLLSDPEAGKVFEVNDQGELIRWFGPEQGLRQPVFARRLFNNCTVIVDAATANIQIYDPALRLLQQTSYWPPLTKASTYLHEPAPDRVLRLHHNELLLIGQKHFMHFSLNLFRPHWVEELPYAKVGRSYTRVFKMPQAAQQSEKPAEQGYQALLRRIRFLQDADAATLAELSNYLSPMRYSRGQWVMRGGEAALAMYFVLEGQVEIVREPEQSILATIRSGDMFGEMALLVGGNRTNSARALVNCQLLRLSRDDFRQVMRRFPQLARKIRQLAQERRTMSHSFQSSRKGQIMQRVKAQMAVRKLKELMLLRGAEESFFEILASTLRPVAFLPEQKVFQRGDQGDTLYFISRGQVEILPQNDADPVAVLGEGDLFGEMALISQQPRSATVKTRGYCQFLTLEAQDFELVAEQFPDFHERVRQLADSRQQRNQAGAETAPPVSAQTFPAFEVKRLHERDFSQRKIYFLSSLHEAVYGIMAEEEIQWAFGQSGERQLFYPYRCTQQADSLLIADMGNDRILEVEIPSGEVVYEGGSAHQLPLQQPRSAFKTPDGSFLVADEGNQRLLLIDPQGQISWEYGSPNDILSPFYAEMSARGSIWFADSALHMVKEISREGETLWSFGHLLAAGAGLDELCEPSYVHQLPDGDVLIADTGNERVLRVDAHGKILVVYQGDALFSLHQPYHCQVLEDELWVFGSDRLTRFDHQGTLLWQGVLGQV